MAAAKRTATEEALAKDDEPTYLSKEALLAGLRRRCVDVVIPMLGDTPVKVRTLSGDQISKLTDLEEEGRQSEAQAFALAAGLVEPRLTEKEIAEIDPDGIIAQAIIGEILRVSAATPKALAEAEARFRK